MLLGIVTILIPIVLTVLFFWLARRAWGSRNAIVKWVGVVLAGLLTLIFALGTILGAVGFIKFYGPQPNPVANVQVPSTPDKVSHGERLAHLCQGCHSTKNALPLDGSAVDFVAEGPPAGSLTPPNLTPAGPLKDWSDGEIIRAIREGVRKNGRALVIMPSDQFHSFSDADVQDIIAYLRSQPPIPHDTPENYINALGGVLLGAGIFPTSVQPPITQPVTARPAGTADHGNYLVTTSGCRSCHGSDLAGGTPGGFTPVGPNLTQIIPKWSNADFIKTIRTGVDPAGKVLNPDMMPYKDFSAADTDDELEDIYTYIHGLPPITE